MNSIPIISILISVMSLFIWLYLIFFRGRFWLIGEDIQIRLADFQDTDLDHWPSVCIIIPARNEAQTIPDTLPNLLNQEYPGPFHVCLVDDDCEDATGMVAESISKKMDASKHFIRVAGGPLPRNWAGKVWALQQGIQASNHLKPKYYLFTDADIYHPSITLKALVWKAEKEQRDLVSLMVKLKAATSWERILVPAFVFFFSKLYPFRWVNIQDRPEAAAAGGCILVRKQALEESGGLEKLSSVLIDDIALANQIKETGGNIWLGLTQDLISLRSYEGLWGVWHMVSRTAYNQLRHSPVLLVLTVLGMVFIYLVPLLSIIMGFALLMLNGIGPVEAGCVGVGLMTWLLMALSFRPMLRWYGIGSRYAPLLPMAGVLYTLMTIDSAIQHYRGRSGSWKGRTYNRH